MVYSSYLFEIDSEYYNPYFHLNLCFNLRKKKDSSGKKGGKPKAAYS
jgi:hypothetical protein